MASSPASANNPLLVSRSAIGEKIGDALRLYVGRGCRYSVKQLSNATGVPDRTIECARCDPDSEDYRPLPLEALASISKFLGAPFASAFLEPCELGAFELSGQAPLPKVLASADPGEDVAEERKRLIRRLAELEGAL